MAFVLIAPAAARAQQQPAPPTDHGQHLHQEPVPAGPAGNPLGLPMAREGSGTAWMPDASPMYGVHGSRGAWELMLHWNAFLQYLDEHGARGADQAGSINWIMAMAKRRAGPGRFGLNAMISLEPLTVGGCGYPDLLATGERCDGHPIVDRQHQHDLFMEVAAFYELPIAQDLALQVYGGPAGEPALGPAGYPHRISALPNPLAPISHHWLDATHITFGVVTASVYGRKWKAEGSLFNGREPDDDRVGFDGGALDSFAGRLWFLPAAGVALQVSAGRLREAEPGENGDGRVDVDRFTASATYHRLFEAAGVWASTVAWGRNVESGEPSDFVMAETNFTLNDRDSWFGRIDAGVKSAHDLDIHASDEMFTVAKFQAGYTRYFGGSARLRPGVGASISVSALPRSLEAVYGTRSPVGLGVFLTLRPAGMIMGAAAHH